MTTQKQPWYAHIYPRQKFTSCSEEGQLLVWAELARDPGRQIIVVVEDKDAARAMIDALTAYVES